MMAALVLANAGKRVYGWPEALPDALRELPKGAGSVRVEDNSIRHLETAFGFEVFPMASMVKEISSIPASR
jgi:hypothetical protein